MEMLLPSPFINSAKNNKINVRSFHSHATHPAIDLMVRIHNYLDATAKLALAYG